MLKKDRKEYFQKFRKDKYTFSVLINKEYKEKLDKYLNKRKITKVKFLLEAIDNTEE